MLFVRLTELAFLWVASGEGIPILYIHAGA